MQIFQNIFVFETQEQLAQAAADHFAVKASEAIAACGRFSVALAGGQTPARTYELLATETSQSPVDWNRVHIFFGDERCVPLDHPDSNYRLANETLIRRVPVPAQNVHSVKDADDPVTSAESYEQELRSFFSGLDWPRFDLILLGLGNDGHTASLFPESSALNEDHAWVVANRVEQLRAYRITLTPPAINNAVNIAFLVAGKEKAAALAAVLNGQFEPKRFPAQLIRPDNGALVWLVDQHAASEMTKHRGHFGAGEQTSTA